MKIKAILTGATGMVGEGVLHECLLHQEIEQVLVVGRRTCGITHPKLREIVLNDFFNLSSIEKQLTGYNACFFCLGTSSVNMPNEEYYKITYTLTMTFTGTLCRLNPNMIFCYISGAGTDSAEKGWLRWARVKGKTENDLMKLPFKRVYNFRPAFMLPTKGLKKTLPGYKVITWLYPALHAVFPNYFFTLKEFGLAMINAVLRGYGKNVLEMPDLLLLSKPDDYKVKNEK
jgi:uncharacterized protein YbjT (DUF2867 family)